MYNLQKLDHLCALYWRNLYRTNKEKASSILILPIQPLNVYETIFAGLPPNLFESLSQVPHRNLFYLLRLPKEYYYKNGKNLN